MTTTDAELNRADEEARAQAEYHRQPEQATAELMPAQQAQVLASAATSARQTAAALEAATQHVIENPGVAGRDEFLALAAQARMLHLSGAAPRAVREDPYIAFHVAMAGRDLGLSPSAALNLIDVIHTQNGPQLSLSPQLRLAQVRKNGLGNVLPRKRTASECVADVIGPDGVLLGQSTFTWEDARMAGLAGPNCQPGQHQRTIERNGRKVCGCNTGYVNYPQRMLWWRAVGYACDDFFPEASIGLYSPEELGAPTDEDGNMLDPADPSVAELPPGYTDPQAAARARQAEADAPADPAELWELQERIAALPDGIQAKLRHQWTHKESRLRGYPARSLPQRLLKMAQSMVNAHWGEATKAGVDMDAELQAVRMAEADAVRCALWLVFFRLVPPVYAPERPEADPAADTPEPAPEDSTAPQEPADETPDEPAKDWRPALRAVSADVQRLAAGVPEPVIAELVPVIQTMHHSRINKELAHAGQADDYPPDSPIDLRRMAVSALCLRLWHAENDDVEAAP